jgi:hypothetical protein
MIPPLCNTGPGNPHTTGSQEEYQRHKGGTMRTITRSLLASALALPLLLGASGIASAHEEDNLSVGFNAEANSDGAGFDANGGYQNDDDDDDFLEDLLDDLFGNDDDDGDDDDNLLSGLLGDDDDNDSLLGLF